jgi:hypothetical protein
MESSSARQRVLAAIRARVLALGTGSWFKESEHLQLSIACASRAPEEVVAVLFGPSVQVAVRGRERTVAITDAEWRVLFGAEVRPWRDAEVAVAAAKPHCVGVLQRLNSALRCTVSETNEGKTWQNSWSRLGVYMALHLCETETLIGTTLGNFVGGDSRRLEELAVEMEDEGIDALMLGEVIVCMSGTVA